jgi:hypothetical protein
MTPERFAELADAHGGDLGRWPAETRSAATTLLAARPAELGPVLTAAARLDAVLDLAPAPAPSAALLGRLIVAAPRATTRAARWLAGLSAGLGLAAAATAGVVAGVAVGGAERADARADAVVAAAYESPSLSDPADEGSET